MLWHGDKTIPTRAVQDGKFSWIFINKCGRLMKTSAKERCDFFPFWHGRAALMLPQRLSLLIQPT
jgi:hypothetical protein